MAPGKFSSNSKENEGGIVDIWGGDDNQKFPLNAGEKGGASSQRVYGSSPNVGC